MQSWNSDDSLKLLNSKLQVFYLAQINFVHCFMHFNFLASDEFDSVNFFAK